MHLLGQTASCPFAKLNASLKFPHLLNYNLKVKFINIIKILNLDDKYQKKEKYNLKERYLYELNRI